VHVVEDRNCADAKLRELVDNYQAVVVHSFNDPFVIAGQGTVMVEFVDQVADLDIVLAPVGGGGLLSGLCLAAHALRPRMAIFACEPASALDAMDSGLSRTVSFPCPTRTRLPMAFEQVLGELTLTILRRHVTGFFVVEEEKLYRPCNSPMSNSSL
jgi:threonine dehydratase